MDTYESLLERAETQLIESSTIILQLEMERDSLTAEVTKYREWFDAAVHKELNPEK